MEWGIVRRFRRPGERKDTYTSESDPWVMFVRVVRERKRRELDPTAQAIRECIAMLPEPNSSAEGKVFSERLSGLLEVFKLLDGVYESVLSTDSAFFSSVDLFKKDSKGVSRKKGKS
jgi:DNA-binding transcriptional regulator GbsR (MarR family)